MHDSTACSLFPSGVSMKSGVLCSATVALDLPSGPYRMKKTGDVSPFIDDSVCNSLIGVRSSSQRSRSSGESCKFGSRSPPAARRLYARSALEETPTETVPAPGTGRRALLSPGRLRMIYFKPLPPRVFTEVPFGSQVASRLLGDALSGRHVRKHPLILVHHSRANAAYLRGTGC